MPNCAHFARLWGGEATASDAICHLSWKQALSGVVQWCRFRLLAACVARLHLENGVGEGSVFYWSAEKRVTGLGFCKDKEFEFWSLFTDVTEVVSSSGRTSCGIGGVFEVQVRFTSSALSVVIISSNLLCFGIINRKP